MYCDAVLLAFLAKPWVYHEAPSVLVDLACFHCQVVVHHCMISHKVWVRTHAHSTDCTTILGVNPLNIHFVSQTTVVWNWVMEVIPVKAEWGIGAAGSGFRSVDQKLFPFTSCSTTALLNSSILGAFLKDLAIRVWAFEMREIVFKVCGFSIHSGYVGIVERVLSL